MIIKIIKYFPFSLTFKSNFTNSQNSYNTRNLFIIKAKDEFNNITYGEISPEIKLPKQNSIEDELKSLFEKEITLSNDFNEAHEQIKNLPFTSPIKSSIEQIYLNLLFINNKIDIHNLFKKNFKSYINVNAIIDISDISTTKNKIRTKYENGYKTFKIKVGRKNFEDDLLLIESIYKEYNNNIKLRLDANGSWYLKEAIKNIQLLENFNIEYIEEPSQSLQENLKLAELSSIKIALDESLKNFNDAKNIIDNFNISFIVVKPLTHYGIFDTVKLIDHAELKNKNIIISSNFESSIGKSALVFLAAYTSHNFAHGLDITEFYLQDICEDSYAAYNGKIKFDISTFPPNFKLLL
ncbi:MAG: hypothetical protein N2249_06115 [Melioribacter sp.]|nr:hypothetical protein [Melioribacter sp.]